MGVSIVVFRPHGYRTPFHPVAFRSRLRTANVEWPCVDETDYAAGLRLVWGMPGDLVVIEHDVLGAHLIPELINCPEDLCVPMVKLYPATTGADRWRWAHSDGHGPIEEHQPYVRTAALCTAKISYSLRRANPLPLGSANWWWFEVDSSLSKWLWALDRGYRWHVHPAEAVHVHRVSAHA